MNAMIIALQPYSTTAVALTVFICLLFFAYRAALPKPIPGIPYNERAAKNLFGDLPEMISHITQKGVVIPWLTAQNAKHHSPLVQFFGFPFSKPTLVLSDFQESQDVLVRRTKEFDRAQRSLDGFKGSLDQHHIAMRSADPRFKGNKELVRDLMSPNFLADVSAAQIYSKSLALVDLWTFKTKAADGRPFEARQDIFDSAMDMINAAAFAFGDNLSIIKNQLNHFLSEDKVALQENLNGSVEFSRLPFDPKIANLIAVADFLGRQTVAPLPVWSYYYEMLTNTKLRCALVAKDEVIKGQIKISLERLEAGDETLHSATDFLINREYAVARKEKRTPDFFSRRNIDELFGYIIGGHETTSSTLCWGLKLIADNQPIQDRLRRSLKSTFPDAISESRPPTAKEIVKANIPYLDAVIEEILRVGQPTPLVARQAMVDTVLLGHHIPKGTSLLINSVGPGYHSGPFQVPDSARTETSKAKFSGSNWELDGMDVFNPDRWLKKTETGEVVYDSHAGPFLSFGLGPRGCFGRRLAYMEMRMILTLLLWNFTFRKLEGELADYSTQEAVTVMPKFCYVGLERIS